MALSSMTGFARGHGVAGAYAWAWELKSVNAKGLDLQLRLPPGWDAVEVPVRAQRRRSAGARHRVREPHGEREGVAPVVRINEPVLDAVLATLKGLAGKVDAAPPTLDGILVAQGRDRGHRAEDESEDERTRRRGRGRRRLRAGAGRARRDAPHARARRSAQVLAARLAEIAALAARAEAAPGRKPEAIKARLAEQVATLLEASQPLRSRPAASGGDPDRHQGRHPRGARPARRACRAGAQA